MRRVGVWNDVSHADVHSYEQRSSWDWPYIVCQVNRVWGVVPWPAACDSWLFDALSPRRLSAICKFHRQKSASLSASHLGRIHSCRCQEHSVFWMKRNRLDSQYKISAIVPRSGGQSSNQITSENRNRLKLHGVAKTFHFSVGYNSTILAAPTCIKFVTLTLRIS